jgi:hypothetical protein
MDLAEEAGGGITPPDGYGFGMAGSYGRRWTRSGLVALAMMRWFGSSRASMPLPTDTR